MNASADGLLGNADETQLNAHLKECESCRKQAEKLALLGNRLQNGFRTRWDMQNGPSKAVLTNIKSQSRRIIMTSRMIFGIKLFAGLCTILVLGVVFNSLIINLQNGSNSTIVPAAEQTSISTNNFNPEITPTKTQTTIKWPLEQKIAFSSNRNGNFEIYVMNTDGTGITNLTNNPARDEQPAWSPDGMSIVFTSDRDGFPDIYIMSKERNDIRLTQDANIEINPTWSPDGKKIAFGLKYPGQDGIRKIITINPDGSDSTDVTILLGDELPLGNLWYWAKDSRNIYFIGRGNLGLSADDIKRYPDMETVYEAGPNGELSVIALSGSKIGGWWNNTHFITNSKNFINLTPRETDWTWFQEVVGEAGSRTSWNPYEKCQKSDAYEIPFYQQSPSGKLIVGVICPDNSLWLYWIDEKGTEFIQLVDAPLNVPAEIDKMEFAWSPDDKFVVFTATSPEHSDLYILNVAEAKKDPASSPPIKLLSENSMLLHPDWNPRP